jgi:hypothetical protein
MVSGTVKSGSPGAQDDRVDDEAVLVDDGGGAWLRVSLVQLAPSSERPAAAPVGAPVAWRDVAVE